MVCELIVISQTATMAGQSVKISENIQNMDTNEEEGCRHLRPMKMRACGVQSSRDAIFAI